MSLSHLLHTVADYADKLQGEEDEGRHEIVHYGDDYVVVERCGDTTLPDVLMVYADRVPVQCTKCGVKLTLHMISHYELWEETVDAQHEPTV